MTSTSTTPSEGQEQQRVTIWRNIPITCEPVTYGSYAGQWFAHFPDQLNRGEISFAPLYYSTPEEAQGIAEQMLASQVLMRGAYGLLVGCKAALSHLKTYEGVTEARNDIMEYLRTALSAATTGATPR